MGCCMVAAPAPRAYEQPPLIRSMDSLRSRFYG